MVSFEVFAGILVASMVSPQSFGPQDIPYDWQTYFGYSAETNKSIVVSGTTFEETGTMTDTDRWQRVSDGVIYSLPSASSLLGQGITSGSFVRKSASYDNQTGLTKEIITVTARTLPDGVNNRTYEDTWFFTDTAPVTSVLRDSPYSKSLSIFITVNRS